MIVEQVLRIIEPRGRPQVQFNGPEIKKKIRVVFLFLILPRTNRKPLVFTLNSGVVMFGRILSSPKVFFFFFVCDYGKYTSKQWTE